MSLEFWHLVVAVVALVLSGLAYMRSVAAWRARVDSKLAELKDGSADGDAVLHNRCNELRDRVAKQEERDYDTADALRSLAEVAGRALGRTEGKD